MVKAFEEAKNLFLVLRIYAYAVVLYRKHPLCFLLNGRNMNSWRCAAPISNRVSDQILKYLL